ncbi:relaxase domain-containing protein [Rhizobiaceae bacterium CRRU44]|uniref:Relaxase domain-containing protein n=1 Tax=Ferranicluibacter rubi TaxID=2715133 RepID=A0AA43ZL92_9HYPH|nr:MobF family relaxase [Ferranicluibacter rubi]NHT78922.1 relaxase domain-containing protein [Ferranicluibacter rubi]
MMTCERISGIEGVAYLHSLEAYAANENKGLSAAGLDANVGVRSVLEATRGAAVYAEYLGGKAGLVQDNGIHEKESQGRKLILGEAPVVDLEKWAAGKRKGKTPPEDVPAFGKTGDVLTFEEALAFGKGYHAETGKALIKHTKAARTVGYDLQFALPKSASLLWGLAADASYRGSAEGARYKAEIEEAQRVGVRIALQYAHANGLIIARRSGDKFGHEGAGHVMLGQYEHKTSREGDPQVHTHNMLFNVCIRADGTTGTLDNKEIKRHAGAIAALYRMGAANHMRQTLGVRASKADRNFEIDGVDEKLVAAFSKRSGQMDDYLSQFGVTDTAMHREMAKYANLNTRKDKSEQPALTELYGRWNMEASALGWRFETIVEAVQEAADKKNRNEAKEWVEKQVAANMEGGEPLPAERPAFDMDEIKARAYSALISTNSVFEERRILKEVFEELQVYTDPETAIKAVEQLIASGDLVALNKKGDDLYFSTAEIIAKERLMIRNALSMRGNLEPIDPETVERFIRGGRVLENGERGFYKDEQKRAIRWACGPDQISFVQGRAGSGKSFMLAGVADIHRAMGRDVHAIAPSHKAKEVVANDAQIAQDKARAVAGFINAYEKGKITIDSNTTLILDEGGMVGLDDMEKLIEIAKTTGARLIVSGDTRQLQPITKGAPMALLSKPEVCGHVVLGEIVRQKDMRQREASILMSEGRITEGFKTYLDTDRVKFTDTALDDTRNAYLKDIDENPFSTRMMGVYRNAHAMKLNLSTREIFKESGLIASVGWTGEAYTRGMNQRVVDREFCTGERIIFGESFKLRDLEISNNTTATILRIDLADEGEPTFTIKTDDGRTFKAKPSEMVGYREEGSNTKHIPKIDYAYAQTVYSLQGSTFDRMFVYAGEAGNAELAYVMMTRHKLDCQVFVDKNRIEDELAASAGKTMSLNPKTGGADENHTTAEEEITLEQVIEKFLAENQKSSAKLNACDFHDSVSAFLGEKIAKEAEREEVEVMHNKPKKEAKAAEPSKGPTFLDNAKPSPFTTSRPMPRGVGQIGQKPEETRAGATPEGVDQFEAVKTLSVGEQARAEAEKQKQDQKPKKTWVNIDQRHIDYIAQYPLYSYLCEHHGFSYVEAYQGGGKKRDDGTTTPTFEGHFLSHPTIGTVSVRQSLSGGKNHGGWEWTLRDGGASGGSFAFENWRYGGKKGDAIRAMYDNLKLGEKDSLSRPPALLSKFDEGQEFHSHSEEVRTKRTIAERIANGAHSTYEAVADGLKSIQKRFRDQVAQTRDNGWVNSYLLRRGIDAETQRQFRGQIGTEMPWSRDNAGGATFAHKDLDGNIWNYERKGEKQAGQKRSFSKMCKGTKRLGLLGDMENPTRIYTTEVLVDGLSVYQHDGRPKGPLIASTFGEGSDEGYRDLYELFKKFPKAEIHTAMDNDSAGKKFAARVEEIAIMARGVDNKLTFDRAPAPQFKDWNDAIQNKVWSKEEKQVNDQWEAEREADRLKGAVKRGEVVEPTPDQGAAALARAEAEAERRRRKEEREASVSKGPSM